MALARPGGFCGSNSALFPGQTIGDIYLSNFFVQPLPNFEDPPGSGNFIHIRLTSAVFHPGFTHFYLETSMGGAGNPNAIWIIAPAWIQMRLVVEDHGTLQQPVGWSEKLNVFCIVTFTQINPPIQCLLQPVVGAPPGPHGPFAAYATTWPHKIYVSHILAAPLNLFHYHQHHRRQPNQHVGMPRIKTNVGRIHRTTRRLLFGTQHQFYRKYA